MQPQTDIWLTTVLRSIGDAVIACDATGSIVFMNPVAESLTGWLESEALGHPLPDAFRIVHETTREVVENPVAKVLRLGTVVGLANHTVLIRRDGSEISIDDSGAPIHDRSGALTGTVLIFRDITARRRAERNLDLLSQSGKVLGDAADFRSTLDDIARLCIRTFSDFCYFDLLHPDGSIERAVRLHRDPASQETLEASSRSTMPFSAGHPVRLSMERGKPVLVEHVTEEWRQSVALNQTHLQGMKALAFHTLLTVPVVSGDRVFGTMSFCRTVNPAPFDQEDCTVASEIASRVAVTLLNRELLQITEEAHAAARLERETIRSLFLQAPAPILMMSGPEFRITLVNEGYVSILRRRSEQDLLGKTIREALPELEVQGFFEILDKVFHTGQSYTGREVLVQLENAFTGRPEQAWFNFVYQPTFNVDGAVNGVLSFAVEISDQVAGRQRAEKQQRLLERQTSEIEALYRTAPIGLALFDPVEFRYLRLNETQAEIVGLPASEIIGKAVDEIAPIPGLRAMFEGVAAGVPLRNAPLEGELPSRPGVHRHWTVNYFPIFADDGSVQAITAASLEITGLKRAETALIQSEKIAAVGRLASSIAHEINNPLEAVTNLLYLAGQTSSLEDIHRYLGVADLELRRISLIASQTLRFYRQSTRPTFITCDDLVTTVLGLYQGRLQNSGITVQIRPWVQRPILCFEGEIRQVLNNLVANSLDAMPHGGRLLIRTHDTVDLATGQPRLILTFADTGTGIAPDVLTNIFEAFFTTKGISGTGLGLWISKGIIEKHHGTIRARSSRRPGSCGTVFRLTLPFTPAS